jgi:hypothetical protein
MPSRVRQARSSRQVMFKLCGGKAPLSAALAFILSNALGCAPTASGPPERIAGRSDASDSAAQDDVVGGCTFPAADYDQSCHVDSDCVAVFLGNACDDSCGGECANAAINSTANARYAADFAARPARPTDAGFFVECSCALGPPGCCRAGTCLPVGVDPCRSCRTSADCGQGFCSNGFCAVSPDTGNDR